MGINIEATNLERIAEALESIAVSLQQLEKVISPGNEIQIKNNSLNKEKTDASTNNSI